MYRRIRSAGVETLAIRPRKFDIGRRNAVRPIEFAIGKRVPYDTEGLFCCLMEHAERAFIPATAQAVAELFEREFTSKAPPGVIRAIEEEFQSNGIAEADEWDDLRRVAAVASFVDQYSRLYSMCPSEFSNPRSARISLSMWIRQHVHELADQLSQYALRLPRRLRGRVG